MCSIAFSQSYHALRRTTRLDAFCQLWCQLRHQRSAYKVFSDSFARHWQLILSTRNHELRFYNPRVLALNINGIRVGRVAR